MVGIYRDDFIKYLKDNLGYAKISSKNIVTKCPWCEHNKEKKHYHLYIALDAPIWRCWQAKCNQSGTISKLTNFIDGVDHFEQFVDKSLITKTEEKRLTNPLKEKKPLEIPELNIDKFKLKSLYIKHRLAFDIDVNNINKLIFDIEEFVRINSIKLDDKSQRMMDFLQSNFIGFLTEHDSLLILRNIDPKATFRYFKINLCESEFLDYYKIPGGCFNSEKVVLSEGIFDIYAEQKNDSLNIKDSVKLYVATLSGSFESVLKSLVFYEQIYRLDTIILSHKDVDMNTYGKLKKFNQHILNTLTIYYNKNGKDFSTFPVIPEKITVQEDSEKSCWRQKRKN